MDIKLDICTMLTINMLNYMIKFVKVPDIESEVCNFEYI